MSCHITLVICSSLLITTVPMSARLSSGAALFFVDVFWYGIAMIVQCDVLCLNFRSLIALQSFRTTIPLCEKAVAVKQQVLSTTMTGLENNLLLYNKAYSNEAFTRIFLHISLHHWAKSTFESSSAVKLRSLFGNCTLRPPRCDLPTKAVSQTLKGFRHHSKGRRAGKKLHSGRLVIFLEHGQAISVSQKFANPSQLAYKKTVVRFICIDGE